MRCGAVARRLAGALGGVMLAGAVGAGGAQAACAKGTPCPYRSVSSVGASDVLFADGASALGFDGRDGLYALDPGLGTIGVIDPATATVRRRLLRFGPTPDTLAGPRGVAVAADGTVEVADADQVKRFDAAGRRLTSWPVPGVTALSLGAGGVTWTADGAAVGAYSPGGALIGSVRIGPEDAPAFPVTVAASATRVLAFGAALPPFSGGPTIGAVGTPGLYGLHLDGSAAFTPNCDTDAEPAMGPSCFAFPVAAAPDGTFWFAVDDRHLAHLDGDGHDLGSVTLAVLGPGTGRPRAIAVSATTGRIAVATSDGTVNVFDPGATAPRLSFHPTPWPVDALVRPVAIAVGRDHSVFVADAAGLVVRRFTPTGRLLARWALPHAAGATVTGLGRASTGDLVAADARRLWLYRPSGKLRRTIRVGSPGIDHMATAPDGRIYVLEAAGRRAATARLRYVRIYDVSGRLRRRVALKAKAPLLATGLAIDARGAITVTSAGEGTTRQANGVLPFTPRGKARTPLRADQPQGIAIDRRGRAFVAVDEAAPADSDPGATAAIDVFRAGRLLTVVGTTGSRAGELHHPRAVATDVVGGATVLWVADAGNHRLQRFVLR